MLRTDPVPRAVTFPRVTGSQTPAARGVRPHSGASSPCPSPSPCPAPAADPGGASSQGQAGASPPCDAHRRVCFWAHLCFHRCKLSSASVPPAPSPVPAPAPLIPLLSEPPHTRGHMGGHLWGIHTLGYRKLPERQLCTSEGPAPLGSSGAAQSSTLFPPHAPPASPTLTLHALTPAPPLPAPCSSPPCTPSPLLLLLPAPSPLPCTPTCVHGQRVRGGPRGPDPGAGRSAANGAGWSA